MRSFIDPKEFEKTDYMKRQPRVDFSTNYNLEQYKRYTKLHAEAKAKDDKELKRFY